MNKCFYCEKDTRKLTKDHIIPQSKGGNGSSLNIVLCCPQCNSRKGNKLPVDYAAELKYCVDNNVPHKHGKKLLPVEIVIKVLSNMNDVIYCISFYEELLYKKSAFKHSNGLSLGHALRICEEKVTKTEVKRCYTPPVARGAQQLQSFNGEQTFHYA